MRIAYFYIALLFCTSGQAQQIVQGTIMDAEKDIPLSNVQVTIKQDKVILQYTYSDEQGHFKIKGESRADNILTFSLIGYKPVEIKMTEIQDRILVKLYPQSIVINEVVIKAPKIRGQGDTVTYFVNQFSSDRDKTIGDVLRKMPGINVDTKGKITYNGKEINKFYIEGQDLLEGKYGIATNGIPQQEVGTVEVYEDHQPIKALEGLFFSDQAAINIKLKEGAKAHWITTLDLESGLPLPLWEIKSFTMLIKKNQQNISILKSNNRGHDLSHECETVTTRGFFNQDDYYNQSQDIDVALPSTPSLSPERTLDNRSHLFSTNQLWGLKNNYQLKGQINYLNDETKSEATSKTIYYLPDGSYILSETENGKSYQNMLTTNLTLIGNKDKFYLRNTLNTEWKWHRIDLMTQNDKNLIQEKAYMPSHKVSNNFNLVKRLRSQSISFSSFILWQSTPNTLDIFTDEKEKQIQSVSTFFLFNNNHAIYSFTLGKFILSLNGGINFLLRQMDSNQQNNHIPVEGDLLYNDIQTNYIRSYLNPKIELNKRFLILTIQCPVSYYHYIYKKEKQRQTMNYGIYSPSLKVQWNLTPDLKWTILGGILQDKPDEFLWYNGWIVQNYRTIRQGYMTTQKKNGKMMNMDISYKNLSLLLFANAKISLQWNNEKYIESQNFINKNLIVRSIIPEKHLSRQQLLQGEVSKGIDFIDGSASLQGIYYTQFNRMYQDESLMPFDTQLFSLFGKLNGKLGDKVDWNYSISYSSASLNVNKNNLFSSKKVSNKVGLSWSPFSKISFQANGEFYRNEIANDEFKNIFFVDAAVVYRINKKYEISLDANNLLNNRIYDYTITSNLSTFINQQQIRRRELFIHLFCQF